jgi:hypothetical protein
VPANEGISDDDEVFVVAMIANLREAFRAARISAITRRRLVSATNVFGHSRS